MTISTFSTPQLLSELVDRGILSPGQGLAGIKKANRVATRAANAAAINELKAQISEAISACETHVFSVKKTSNSIGVMNLVSAERSQVLKALTQLTADGVFRKVGLVGGVEKLPSEVNAFQIRYIRVTDTSPAEFATNESDEEAK